MNTTAKIATRILRELEAYPAATVLDATRKACWKALGEVRAMGWTEDRQAALVDEFARVGAEILAGAIAQA